MKLTEAEWQIMNALWSGAPATARQIVDRLPHDVNWAYTTVKTMLTRLTDKNAIRESKNGNQAFDGAFGPLMHFLLEDQKLSGKQKEEILRVLQEAEQKGANND